MACCLVLEEVRVRSVDPTEVRLDYANDVDCPVYREAVFVNECDGAPVMLATHVPRSALRSVRGWCLSTKSWAGTSAGTTGNRLGGFVNPLITFGSTAPVALRRRFGVSMSGLNQREPVGAGLLDRLGVLAWGEFSSLLPDSAETQIRMLDRCDPTWLVGGSTGWTSGVVNKTSVLPYHFDSGNIAGSWNAQVVLRDRIGGGALHCPSIVTLDGRSVALACDDASLILFDGQSRMHGVTPLVRRRGGYRYSIVYYAKAAMTEAGSPRSELLKAKRRAATSGLGESN